MIENYENKLFKLNYDLKDKNRTYKKGGMVKVKMKDDVPVNKFWRDKLKDSKIDNCMELVETKKKINIKEKEGK